MHTETQQPERPCLFFCCLCSVLSSSFLSNGSNNQRSTIRMQTPPNEKKGSLVVWLKLLGVNTPINTFEKLSNITINAAVVPLWNLLDPAAGRSRVPQWDGYILRCVWITIGKFNQKTTETIFFSQNTNKFTEINLNLHRNINRNLYSLFIQLIRERNVEFCGLVTF